MDKETKALMCILRLGQNKTESEIGKIIGCHQTVISYHLNKLLKFRSPYLSRNEVITKQSRINDDFTCGD